MAQKELAHLSMTQLSAMVRERKLSVVELVNYYLKRIERLNPKLNAYITVCGDEALAQAKRIDASLAKGSNKGNKKDILLGMPISLKDQFETRGVVTTYGSLAFKDHTPDEDCTVVARFKKAGAIILGKLNMSEFACGATENMPYGTARNPWNTNHTPSGSSSGSGIAVAAGLCAAAMGEDTGGSGRGPACVSNEVGHRPSSGLVSRYGVQALSPSMDSATTLTHTVEDSALLLQVIAGWDPNDPLSSHRPVPDFMAALQGGIKGVRIGVLQEAMDNPALDKEVKAAAEAAFAKMAELGAVMDEASIPQIGLSSVLFAIAMAEGAAINKKWLDTRLELFRQSTRLSLLTGALLPTKAYTRARQGQALVRAQTLAALKRCDVLVCPTSAALPATIEEMKKSAIATTKAEVVKRHGGLTGYTGFAALSGTPAISVPCGFSKSGLPIGLQVIGKPFDDATVLRVAHAYEQSTDWHTRHPDL